jgi:hypothetical protein
MKTKFRIIISCIVVLYLSSCDKRNFFPDPDDPGLSLLTSHGFNIVTAYINGVPFINRYSKPLFGGTINSVPVVRMIATASIYDTLSISWQFERNDSSRSSNQFYPAISLLMPVPKSFTKPDFFALNNQRFSSNTNAVVLRSFNNYSDSLSGTSNIYFVNIKYDHPSNTSTYLAFSGLFNGNIGDSILITKGRFDFEIDAANLNF